MITDQQINTFIQQGAVLLENVLEPKVIDFASESMDRLYAPFTSQQTGVIQYVLGEAFEAIYQHPNLELIAKKILGCKHVDFIASAVLHTKPNTKEWGYDKTTEHVDVQFNINEWSQIPRKILFTFMIFLDDVTADRAPTLIRLGSHLTLAKHYGETIPYRENPTNLSFLPKLNFSPLTPLTGLKGQIAVSTTALIHTGSLNATDKARKVLFVSFAPKGSNICFNRNLAVQRLEYMQELHKRFKSNRKHLVEGTIEQLESIVSMTI